MANENCRFKNAFDNVTPEALKELLNDNCGTLMEAADQFKKSYDEFQQEKAKVDENYINVLLDWKRSEADAEGILEWKNINFLYNVPDSYDNLNEIYRTTDYYFGGSGGIFDTTWTAQPEDAQIDAAIERFPDLLKDEPLKEFNSISWYRKTANKAIKTPDLAFGIPSDQDFTEQISKLEDLSAALLKMLKIMDELRSVRLGITPGSQQVDLPLKIVRIEQKHKSISALQVDLGTTGQIFKDSDPDERADALEELVADVGTKTGSNISLLIPPNFREQCLFLAQIFQFAEFHKTLEKEANTGEPTRKPLPYVGINQGSNASLVVEGSPFGFVNKLTQYASMSNYFDATNDQLAHLQPLIRIFKVTPEKGEGSGGIIEREQEFAFDTFASQEDVSDLLKPTNRRGFGIGIEKFNFTFHGSNPFAIKKSIKANLVIKANNFSELLRPRGPNNSYRYIDLALKTGKSIKEKTGNPELDYRIKAVVGLSVPNGKTTARYKGKGPGDTGDITEAVKNNFATLNLTPVIHTFDFDDTGAVTFSIEYLAYIEEFLDKARMNVFADPVVSKRVLERRLAIQTQKTNCSKDNEVKNLNSFLEEDAVETKNDKIKSLQFLTRELLGSNKIYYLNINKDQFKDLIQKGPFYDVLNLNKAITPALQSPEILDDLEKKFNEVYDDGKELESVKNSFKISDLESKNYAFFYLGDLVDLILKKIPENLNGMIALEDSYKGLQIESEKISEEEEIIASSYEKFKKFRFILGPLEIIDHQNGSQSKSVSFADVPIALDYFNEWLTSKLLQNDRVAYPLTTFLNDLMNDLVSNFLNDDTCYNFNIKQKTRVFQSMITAYSDDGEAPINDQITNYLVQRGQTRLDIDDVDYNIMRKPILSTGGYREYQIPKKDPSKEFHFFVFYAGRVQPKDSMQGVKKDDEDAGIFHYVLGKDRGIVKTIKLNKTDSPASLKMVRFEQEGYDGLQQLREIYDVDVTTFANLGTYPGTYIFVDPRGFSPDLSSFDQSKFDLTDLGIGGYYMIIESTHEFSSGVMNTSFRAKWVQAIESEEKERQNNSSTGNGEQVTKKCSVRS